MSRPAILVAGFIGLSAVLASCLADTQRCPGGGSVCSTRQDDLGDAGADGIDSSHDAPDQNGEDGVEEDGAGSDAATDAVEDWQSDPNPDGGLDTPVEPSVDTLQDGLDSGPDTADGSRVFRLDIQPQLTLPYTVQGDWVPDGNLEVYEVGGAPSAGSLEVTVEGPFEVTGSLAPLQARETRHLTVRYTGSVAEPVLVNGWARVEVDGQQAEAGLGAVIGDAGIPAAVWTTDDYGDWTLVDLPSAPFPHPSASWTDSSVLILVPDGLVDRPDIGVVLHLHGHNAIVEERVAQQWLGEQQTLSGRNAVFVAPQGPVDYPSGNFGKLHDPDGAAHLVRDVFCLLYRDGFIERPLIGEVVLTSHSGGYHATADILDVGGLDVLAVQLYDSLYGLLETFESFVLAGGVFRSNYTASGGTGTNNQTLTSWLENAGIDVGSAFGDAELWIRKVIIGYTAAAHDNCMYHERTAARWLTTSGLAPRPDAPPELLRTIDQGGSVTVQWRPDLGAANTSYQVQGSTDGLSWETLADTNLTEASVQARPFLRVVRITEGWGASDPSDTYGATGDDWLIVDGFDRVIGGSYDLATHPFAASVGVALGEPFSIASNEAVTDGLVDLADHDHVLWMLGDESVRDLTFDTFERTLVKSYVDGGGDFVVTGSELGYASDRTWLGQVLHVTYVSDDANTNRAGGYTFGVAYEEDYPDVLGGQTTIWTYATGGAAAVVWNSRIIAVGFPLETLAESDRSPAVQELIGWLE